MANVEPTRGKRLATVMLWTGVGLIVLNVGGVAFAIYAPIFVYFAPSDVLFTVSEATIVVRTLCLLTAAFAVLAVFQIAYLPKLITKMVEDSAETVRAELALKWAQRIAYVVVLVCVASLAMTTRTFRNWAEILKNVS